MDTIEFLRQFRIVGYAIFDLALAFVGIYLIAPLLSKIFRKIRLEIPRKSWMLLTLPLGVVIHIIAGSITPMTASFLETGNNYILKIVIIGLTLMGILGIKIIKK